MLKIKQNLHRL